jgi:gamma-polyglutamate biosynthesis protein CapA
VPERSATLHAVGDIAFGDHPLTTGFGTHSRHRGRDPGFAFERVRSALAGADILFGNLECTLSHAGLKRRDLHSTQMRGQPGYLAGLTGAGFTVLNLANNHALQHGEDAFRDTARMLSDAGIGVCGVSAGDYRSAAPAFVERNGLRIAFLGYSLRPRQYFTREPIYAEGFYEQLLDDVRRAKADAGCVVVSLHWGSEFIDRPAPDEIAIAHRIVDAGADLIIGHHPHVLRGIERRGRATIVYSLGNFVCDMIWEEPLRETAMPRFRLSAGGAELEQLVPIRINDDYQPVPLEGEPAARLLARIAGLSQALEARAAGAPSESQADYERAADAAQRENRSRSHRYFLRHLHRFPLGIVFQQFSVYLRNRLAERGIVRMPDSTAGC